MDGVGCSGVVGGRYGDRLGAGGEVETVMGSGRGNARGCGGVRWEVERWWEEDEAAGRWRDGGM
jgi:hypothetical protein